MKKTLLDIYHKLYDHFGPRGWWPAETNFEVCLGAILTQNVAWRNVVKAIDALKEEGLLEVTPLYLAPHDQVAGLIRPTRYYNQKATRLKDFCSLVVNGYAGDIERLLALPTENLRSTLLGIKGIGKETADSIVLYAAQKPVFVVDAYTSRIFGRLGIIPDGWTYDRIQSFFTANLPKETELYNEYHALIDGLGNRYCSGSSPRCGLCPLGNICRHHKALTEDLL